ncbi:zinc ABC transporter substrate-binding protein [Candidatus Peregrinibacteria bacterium]|nr:MAG: zinc ABC transporter substrate-binding protein [Candidatus Peregrinibacteria bacterium]
MKKWFFCIGIVGIFLLGGCTENASQEPSGEKKKITVVSALFPLYDFAKQIGGNSVEAYLLLPPGTEPHDFEPTPSDISKIKNADVFLYTGDIMEPWVHDVLEGVHATGKTVDTSARILLMEESSHEDKQNPEGMDPHIWLNFENAQKMAEDIADAFLEVDPKNADYYRNNLEILQANLSKLDAKYKSTLVGCTTNTIIYGGHYAFGYLAKQYGLQYKALQGFSPDSEPSAKDLVEMVNQIQKENISSVFSEELSNPKIAEMLAQETHTHLFSLNPAENITRKDYTNGVSYLSIMEENLKNLSLGLQCEK